jgi:hypothetical protein
MANSAVKAPVLSDLVKFNQPDFVGREAAKITSATALKVGTVLMGGPDLAKPWDLSDAADIYGILLTAVPANSSAYPVTVLFAGPAQINPYYLVWATAAAAADIKAGLEQLKKFNFIFEIDAVTNKLYPRQIDRV